MKAKKLQNKTKIKKIVGKSPNAAENLVFKRKVFKSTSQRIESSPKKTYDFDRKLDNPVMSTE